MGEKVPFLLAGTLRLINAGHAAQELGKLIARCMLPRFRLRGHKAATGNSHTVRDALLKLQELRDEVVGRGDACLVFVAHDQPRAGSLTIIDGSVACATLTAPGPSLGVLFLFHPAESRWLSKARHPRQALMNL